MNVPAVGEAGLVRHPAALATARRRETAVAVSIVVLACLIRLPGLFGDGLWRDQANVYVQLSAPDFAEFFRRVVGTEWHPPLYFALVYGWTRIAGTSEFALTGLPFAFGIATVALVYRLGKSMAGFGAGAIAALLYAMAPFAVAYSCEYLYPLAGFVSMLAAWLVFRARGRLLTPRGVATLATASLLAVCTHYTALIYVPLLALWALTGGAPLRRRIGMACALAAGAVPFVLWLPVFVAQRRIGLPYQSAPSAADKLAFFVRALEGFVQHTGATNADVFWMATMSLANWTANVILPMFALTQLVAMALHMGGVVSEIYPGSAWIRKFIAAIAALSVSGIMRLAESMVTQAHGIGG